MTYGNAIGKTPEERKELIRKLRAEHTLDRLPSNYWHPRSGDAVYDEVLEYEDHDLHNDEVLDDKAQAQRNAAAAKQRMSLSNKGRSYWNRPTENQALRSF